jgi:hypothetical protein
MGDNETRPFTAKPPQPSPARCPTGRTITGGGNTAVERTLWHFANPMGHATTTPATATDQGDFLMILIRS